MGDDGVVQGGNKRRVQVRAERKDGFTAERRQLFLDHLAGCSNVSQAAAAVGTTSTTINYHRRRDPAFAQACAEALEAGYLALEAMLLERAAHGGAGAGSGGAGAGGYVPGLEADRVPGAETVDTDLAQFLLSLRAREMGQRTGKGRTRTVRVTEKELNASLLAKLKLLGAGLRGEGKRAGKRGAGKGAGRGSAA